MSILFVFDSALRFSVVLEVLQVLRLSFSPLSFGTRDLRRGENPEPIRRSAMSSFNFLDDEMSEVPGFGRAVD